MFDETIAPEADEIEVVILGPGYGECILVHVGFGEWIVIDSFKYNGKTAAKEYLASINVPPENVKLLVITHWDADHIHGIVDLYNLYTSSKVVISSVMSSEKFIHLTRILADCHNDADSNEYVNLLKAVANRKDSTMIQASAKKTIFERPHKENKNSTYSIKVSALSPSDYAHLSSIKELGDLYKKNTRRGYLPKVSSNNASIVLKIEIEDVSILLGGDLENPDNTDLGWRAIVKEDSGNNLKSSIIKIPHHGSKNAFNQDVWKDMLINNAHAVITPFNRHPKLPSPEGAKLISDQSDKAYLTASPRVKEARYSGAVRKEISALAKKISNVNNSDNEIGAVRFRYRINSQENTWQVKLLGQAMRLEKYLNG